MRPSLLLTMLLAAAMSGPVRSQVSEADPRYADDPRQGSDPRGAADPRAGERDPYLEPPGPKLFDLLYEAGDEGRLVEAMRTGAWALLPYIDTHCESWLSMIERGSRETETGRERLAELELKGRKLAALADGTLIDTQFSRYVDAFFGWDEEQQKQLREGQELYRRAVAIVEGAPDPQTAQTAMTPLRQALDRARGLGDLWGQSMTLAVMGTLQAQDGLETECRATMSEALRIGRSIRDMDSVWRALSMIYESAMRTYDFDAARQALQDQYLIATEVGDEAIGDSVLQQLVNLDLVEATERGERGVQELPGPDAPPQAPR
jgi:hypothetical protein